MVTPEEKDQLLKKYWSIPERQIETSVVLGDERYLVLPSRRASSGHRGSSGGGSDSVDPDDLARQLPKCVEVLDDLLRQPEIYHGVGLLATQPR